MNIDFLAPGCVVKKLNALGEVDYKIVVLEVDLSGLVIGNWTKLSSGEVFGNHRCDLRYFEGYDFVLEVQRTDKKLEDFF
jgi:hypothetical protein